MHPFCFAVKSLILCLAHLPRDACGLVEEVYVLVLPTAVSPEDGNTTL